MLEYIVRRVLIFIPTIFLIAIIGFITMELPQGDIQEVSTAAGRIQDLQAGDLSSKANQQGGDIVIQFGALPDFGLVAGWDLSFPGTADPEQFYIKK